MPCAITVRNRLSLSTREVRHETDLQRIPNVMYLQDCQRPRELFPCISSVITNSQRNSYRCLGKAHGRRFLQREMDAGGSSAVEQSLFCAFSSEALPYCQCPHFAGVPCGPKAVRKRLTTILTTVARCMWTRPQASVTILTRQRSCHQLMGHTLSQLTSQEGSNFVMHRT